MAVPANLAALSTTAASNAPAGTDSVFPELDNFIRAYGAFIAQLRDGKFSTAGGTISGQTIWQSGGAGTFRVQVGNAGYSSFASWYTEAGVRQAYIGIMVSPTYVDMNAEILPFRFTIKPPQSSVAASTANELVRKQEMDAAIAAIPAPFQARKMVTITASGTYTPTGDPTKFLGAVVYAVGGGGQGGGGGSAGGNNSGGGGGGGGGTAIGWITPAQIGAGVTVTIGAGGTAGGSADTIGGAGGPTSFGTLLIGSNGGGGRPGGNAGGPGGEGGGSSGSALQTGIRGSGGGSGSAFSVGAPGSGGAGGCSSRGGGGYGGQGGFAPVALVASSYGGGGGGSGVFSSGASPGAPGVVVVDEHYRA